jgi:glycosyltransferase involved in cell wall biosynthesis
LVRLLCVTTSPYPYADHITDGPGYRAYTLFHRLVDKGHEIVVLSLYESFHLSKREESECAEDGIRIRTIRHSPARIARAILEEAPSVVYTPWSTLPFLSRFKERIPIIIDYVGSGLLEELATTGRVPAHLLRLTLDSFWQGDFLITSGERFRMFILAMLIASKRVTLKSASPDDPLIHLVPMSLPPGQLPFRQKNFEDLTRIHIILAGTTLPWYDYPTLFKALEQVSDKNLDCEMTIMGGNPKNRTLEKSIETRAHSIGQNVTFTGVVPFRKRGEFYKQADIGLNIAKPTLEDRLSIRTRIFDYMWGGLPVLTCGRDEYSELVTREGAGFSYHAGSVDDLVDRLLLIRNKKDWVHNVEAGISKVRQTIEEDAARTDELDRFLKDPQVDPSRKGTARVLSSAAITLRDYVHSLTS